VGTQEVYFLLLLTPFSSLINCDWASVTETGDAIDVDDIKLADEFGIANGR
jgi:hypothetical protein